MSEPDPRPPVLDEVARLDDVTTLSALKERVRAFCDERDWDRFHGAKDLAIGLVTEASEVLEHFRFQSEEDIAAILGPNGRKAEVEAELADALFFILRFAGRYDIDLARAFERKLERNAAKYPVDSARGSNRKYNRAPLR